MSRTLPTAADVVVVGAGLAGLATALRLTRDGLDVVVVEAAQRVGGRVVTDRVEGLLLDRGFQLLNPAYPAVRDLVDVAALELSPFEAGVAVYHGGRLHRLGDPRRQPSAAWRDLTTPVLTLRQKLALVAWMARVGFGPAATVRRQDDAPLGRALAERGLSGAPTDRVLRPFLAGVLADGDLETSRRYADLVVRSFVRGTPSLPARGMQALPEQLHDRLGAGRVHLGVAAQIVTGHRVVTDSGTIGARASVVATDPVTAADLLGWPRPRMRGLTTLWWRAAAPPTTSALLHVDGEARGPVVNAAVVSQAAPGYAQEGSLVQASVLGAGHDPAELEPAARAQTARILGADARGWELVRVDDLPRALPALAPGTPLQRHVDLGAGVFVAGDHRDTPSIQGALVSGRRAAAAVRERLRQPLPPAARAG